MKRDWQQELTDRCAFIKDMVQNAHAKGVVLGNSGGKDCTLVAYLCKHANVDTLGVSMPCHSRQNYGSDLNDAKLVAERLQQQLLVVDLTASREQLIAALNGIQLPELSTNNIAPRLRMLTLYALAAAQNRLVIGTGNASERYIGYFTKYGDGACDFNPIADLTVREVYEFLRFLGAPPQIIDKKPSAGLFEGQTDEGEIGMSYDTIDSYILGENVQKNEAEKIEKMHQKNAHKLKMPKLFHEK